MENNSGTKRAMENDNNAEINKISPPAQEENRSFANKFSETAGKVKESLSEKSQQISESLENSKEKVSDNLANTADKIHLKSDTAQEYFDGKADQLNDYAHQAIGKANQFGHRTAEVLTDSSDYVKNFDYTKTKQQVKDSFRKKPELGLAVAGIFGLLIGLLVGRRTSR